MDIPGDIRSFMNNITIDDSYEFLSVFHFLSQPEQEKVIHFFIGKGRIDIVVHLFDEIEFSYRVSREDIFLGLSQIDRIYPDEFILRYILLYDHPEDIMQKVAECGYIHILALLSEKFPDIPRFPSSQCSPIFKAYFYRFSQFGAGFLGGRNWGNIFGKLFEDPQYAHSRFEQIFQNLHSGQYKKLDERMEDYRSAYSKLPLSIIHTVERKPTTYTDDSKKYIKDILLKVGLSGNASGKLIIVNFHTLDGLKQVFLDTHKKIEISHIAPGQFFCHTKEGFLQTIHDIASQLEVRKLKEEIAYTVVVMRENGSKDTHPSAANDEVYQVAA